MHHSPTHSQADKSTGPSKRLGKRLQSLPSRRAAVLLSAVTACLSSFPHPLTTTASAPVDTIVSPSYHCLLVGSKVTSVGAKIWNFALCLATFRGELETLRQLLGLAITVQATAGIGLIGVVAAFQHSTLRHWWIIMPLALHALAMGLEFLMMFHLQDLRDLQDSRLLPKERKQRPPPIEGSSPTKRVDHTSFCCRSSRFLLPHRLPL